jgi:hypothetical protein
MDASLFFPERYLKGDDFTAREVTLTIRTVNQETLHSEAGDESKIVLYFEEIHRKAESEGRVKDQKRMVLSKSLFVDFVTMFNSKETKDWHGKRITLYRGKAIKGGKMVIRARIAPETQTPVDPAETQK